MPAMEPIRLAYDVVVVGARAAGAPTAMLIARQGGRVLVVERGAAGADTLSTHAQMRGAAMLLARWGLRERVAAIGAPAVRRTEFVYGDRRVEIALKPSHGIEALHAPRRSTLDALLAGAAAAAGAELRFGVALQDVLHGAGGRVVGVRLALPGGRMVDVRAGLVIGADGRRSTVARRVGAPVERAGRNAAAVVYAYAGGLADRGYRWLYRPGLTGGAIPTDRGLHCVFVSTPPTAFRSRRGDLGALLRRGLAELDPELAAEVARGAPTRPLGFAGEPGFVRRSHGPGWALAGDAGHFRDPITSHGIADAFRDAELLARAALAGGGAALAAYQAERDALSAELFDVTDRIAGLDWDLDRIEALHRELATAMKAQQAWIAALARPQARAAEPQSISAATRVESGSASPSMTSK
jgi:2-polyprenyl-6-methoxyphenol hydroxylase-like FAD-dependent oxidoreductase